MTKPAQEQRRASAQRSVDRIAGLLLACPLGLLNREQLAALTKDDGVVDRWQSLGCAWGASCIVGAVLLLFYLRVPPATARPWASVLLAISGASPLYAVLLMRLLRRALARRDGEKEQP